MIPSPIFVSFVSSSPPVLFPVLHNGSFYESRRRGGSCTIFLDAYPSMSFLFSFLCVVPSFHESRIFRRIGAGRLCSFYPSPATTYCYRLYSSIFLFIFQRMSCRSIASHLIAPSQIISCSLHTFSLSPAPRFPRKTVPRSRRPPFSSFSFVPKRPL